MKTKYNKIVLFVLLHASIFFGLSMLNRHLFQKIRYGGLITIPFLLLIVPIILSYIYNIKLLDQFRLTKKRLVNILKYSVLFFIVAVIPGAIFLHIVYPNDGISFLSTKAFRYFTSLSVIIVVIEEIYFRGVLLEQAHKLTSFKFSFFRIEITGANLITAFLFMIYHPMFLMKLHLIYFLTFFPGLLFGYIKEKTGALYTPIIIHQLCNFSVQLVDAGV